jgi:hypothetical protein
LHNQIQLTHKRGADHWDGVDFVPAYEANGSLLLKVTLLKSEDSIVEVTSYKDDLQNWVFIKNHLYLTLYGITPAKTWIA